MTNYVKNKMNMRGCTSLRSTRSRVTRNNPGFQLSVYFIVISAISFVPTICGNSEIDGGIFARANLTKSALLHHANATVRNDTNIQPGNTDISLNQNRSKRNTDEDFLFPNYSSQDKRRQINKCCPFHQVYENNSCVDVQSGIAKLTNITAFVVPLMTHNIETSEESLHLHLQKKVWYSFKISMPDCQSYEMTEKVIHASTDVYNNTHDSSIVLFATHDRGILIRDSHLMSTIPKDDFCLDQVNETSYIAVLCKPTCSEKKPCVRKCCSPYSVFDVKTHSCVVSETDTQWRVPIFYNNSVDMPLQNDTQRQIHYTYGLPNCSITYQLSGQEYPDEKMHTFVNGSLATIHKGKQIIYSPDIYCQDTIRVESPGVPLTHSKRLDQIGIVCFPEDNDEDYNFFEETGNDVHSTHAIGIFVTVFFLTLTAIVYLILWKHLHIHDWLQFAYVVSSMVAFLLLGILKLHVDVIGDYSSNLCIAMGTSLHFSFLCSFFWFTSMTLNFWWTFRGCESSWILPNVGGARRFCVFALFSLGSAGMISGTGFTLDRIYRYDVDSTVIRPRIGERSCHLFGYEEQGLYLYGPLICLLFVDLAFFCSTIYLLYKIRRQEARIATLDILTREKKSFMVFTRFFVVVEVLCTIEVISWLVLGNPDTEESTRQPLVFHIIDIIATWQGVAIFIVLICRTDIYRRLKSNIHKSQPLLESDDPFNRIQSDITLH